MSLLLALAGATQVAPVGPPSVQRGGGAVPLYLYRRPVEQIAKPRKPRRRRIIDALVAARVI